MPAPVVDAHSDLLLELVHAEDALGETDPLRARWLAPLRRGGVGLQVCAIFADPALGASAGISTAVRQALAFRAALARNRDGAFAVECAADLEQVGGERVGLLLSLEGMACCGEELWPLEALARLGLRMAALTWEERNAFAAGGVHDAGLTRLGEAALERMWELGVVPDLAHASARTLADALACADGRPLLVSHAACRAVREHPRNLADDQLRALAQAGGVLGLMPHPLTVDPREPTLERFLAHVDHAVEVMGIEHVGLGGDFLRQVMHALGESVAPDAEGVTPDAVLDGLAGQQDYPTLLAALRRRGYADDAVARLAGGNLLRLLRDSLPA